VVGAKTNIEVVIVGMSRARQQQLTRLEVRKLECVMEKRRRASNTKLHYVIAV